MSTGIRSCEFPYSAILLAYDLGMAIDIYLTGSVDDKGNRLMFLDEVTSQDDRKTFASMYAESIS